MEVFKKPGGRDGDHRGCRDSIPPHHQPSTGLTRGRRPSLRLAKLRHACFLLLHLCLTSAARPPLPSVCACASTGACSVCVQEKLGERGSEPTCNFLYASNLSFDFRGPEKLEKGNEKKQRVEVRCRRRLKINYPTETE